MFRKIDDFVNAYTHEKDGTQKMMNALTDASLDQSVLPGHRNLGRMAWHIVVTYPEITAGSGITINGVDPNAPTPKSAAQIASTYTRVSDELMNFVKTKWNDAKLLEEKEFYGQTWSLGKMLHVIVNHEVHHRGQMTVLMRQAGLKVPGVYGPALEEWAAYGQPAPQV